VLKSRRGAFEPSRFRFSGEPMNFTYWSNVMPLANRSAVTALVVFVMRA